MKKLGEASSKIRENESELTFFIKDIEKVQIQNFIREILYLDGIFSFKAIHQGNEEYFQEKDLDFSIKLISDSECLCEEHGEQFLELEGNEEKSFVIQHFKRFELYQAISSCKECTV
ncbi:tRNA modification GTPase, partial [Bacillus cereus]